LEVNNLDEKPKIMLVSDAETAQRAILDMINSYPDFPPGFKPSNSTILWNSIKDTQSIGVFPAQDPVYLKKYVSGSYVGQMTFQIVYKSNPTTNKDNIAASNLLENIAKFLESGEFTLKDKNFVAEQINRTSDVFCGTADGKTTELAINMQLKYFYKK
jgi:hypothetical protein